MKQHGKEPDPRNMTRDELVAYLRGRATTSVPFAGACHGAGRSTSYHAASSGSLKVIKLGSKLRVPTAWLEEQLGLSPAHEESPGED
jgi:hypothetical protein